MSRAFVIILFFAIFAILSTSAVDREGSMSGVARMEETKIAECLRSKHCAITMDHRPCCGSDGRTYPNKRTVDCLNECLSSEEKVTIESHGFCKADMPQ